MPNVVPRRFSHPEMFRKIRPELLLAWLWPAKEYLARRGLVLPSWREDRNGHLSPALSPKGGEGGLGTPGTSSLPGGAGGLGTPGTASLPEGGAEILGARGSSSLRVGERALPIDYDGLVRVFMEPTADMPGQLVDGLYLVHEMGRARHLDRMVEEARANGLALTVESEDTATDIALKLLLLDQRLLESLQNCHEVTRPRGFQYFVTDASPVPRFEGPTLEQVRALEERLNAFYVASHGGAGARVFAYCQQRAWHDAPEWLFLVRHGAPFRREEAMEGGQPTSVVYRPRKCAVLKYDTLRGEMGVYCGRAREQRVLLKMFGRVLFGRPDFFPIGAKFDLRPLVKLGRASLAFEDVPGIEEVRLTGVEFFQRSEPWHRTVQEAGDIFTLIEREEIRWPARLEEITRATFTVRLWRQKWARRLSIVPCNRALYSRDEGSPILERWMVAREIIQACMCCGVNHGAGVRLPKTDF